MDAGPGPGPGPLGRGPSRPPKVRAKSAVTLRPETESAREPEGESGGRDGPARRGHAGPREQTATAGDSPTSAKPASDRDSQRRRPRGIRRAERAGTGPARRPVLSCSSFLPSFLPGSSSLHFRFIICLPWRAGRAGGRATAAGRGGGLARTLLASGPRPADAGRQARPGRTGGGPRGPRSGLTEEAHPPRAAGVGSGPPDGIRIRQGGRVANIGPKAPDNPETRTQQAQQLGSVSATHRATVAHRERASRARTAQGRRPARPPSAAAARPSFPRPRARRECAGSTVRECAPVDSAAAPPSARRECAGSTARECAPSTARRVVSARPARMRRVDGERMRAGRQRASVTA